MLKTHTGGFPIGYRRGWTEWHKNLPQLLEWLKSHQLSVLDLGQADEESVRQITAAGLQVGSADAPDWGKLISPDKATREAAVAKNVHYMQTLSKLGVHNFFIVMLPEKPDVARAENFKHLTASMEALAPKMDACGARLVIEGYPGAGALCCTPEGYRALFKAVPSKAMGINFDPSHLLRMGIDPVRFLREFADRVYHVHGKDAEIIAEGAYEYGHEQPATFAKAHGFGSHAWRYTIPGHGQTRWTETFRILKDHGYKGAVSIELEDENFNGSEDGEKRGILAGASYLADC